MSSIVNHFSIFSEFQNKLNIKVSHVFKDEPGNTGYCVTNDDKVYGFGRFVWRYLGYNESNDNKSYVLIQLCDKNIEQFFGNSFIFFATSESNMIYSWGMNTCGQLGREFKSIELLKPKKNKFFYNKNTVGIRNHPRILIPKQNHYNSF